MFVPHSAEWERKTEMRALAMLRRSRICLGITMENIWLRLFAPTSTLVRHNLFSRHGDMSSC